MSDAATTGPGTPCPLCGIGRNISEPTERFAVWLNSRGWLIDVCGEAINFAPRLAGATWFATEEEAEAALRAVDDEGCAAEYPELIGSVVTL